MYKGSSGRGIYKLKEKCSLKRLYGAHQGDIMWFEWVRLEGIGNRIKREKAAKEGGDNFNVYIHYGWK